MTPVVAIMSRYRYADMQVITDQGSENAGGVFFGSIAQIAYYLQLQVSNVNAVKYF